MDALDSAAPLARSLLRLALARASGTVRIRAGQRSARLRLHRGTLADVVGVESDVLGDSLLRAGLLDGEAHRRALDRSPPRGPVGEWLVEVGVASREDVSRALALQYHARVGAVLRWQALGFRFEQQAGADAPPVTVDLQLALWDGLMAIARSRPGAAIRDTTATAALELNVHGRAFTAALLSAGVMERDVLTRVQAGAGPEMGRLCTRAVLVTLGVAEPRDGSSDAYSLLLRKRRQIRCAASAEALLDLPVGATSQHARRSLRRLARQLHPDRFSASSDQLRAISGDVMRELSRAAASF